MYLAAATEKAKHNQTWASQLAGNSGESTLTDVFKRRLTELTRQVLFGYLGVIRSCALPLPLASHPVGEVHGATEAKEERTGQRADSAFQVRATTPPLVHHHLNGFPLDSR